MLDPSVEVDDRPLSSVYDHQIVIKNVLALRLHHPQRVVSVDHFHFHHVCVNAHAIQYIL